MSLRERLAEECGTDVVDIILEMVAAEIEQMDVPIDIEHWMGTRKQLSAETALAIARSFREAADAH